MKPSGTAASLFTIIVIILVVFSAVGYYLLAPSTANLSQPTAAGTSSSPTGGAQRTLAGRYQ